MVRETRHLWVGNLPENVRDEKIIEHFKRYGRVESVKILPKRGSDGGVAAFVDFVDIKSAQKAHNAVNKMGDRDLRTDYNEPGTIPGAARVLDDTVSITSRTREVSGFRGGSGAPAYGPPQSLHAREGRYERRLDGASETRERTYEHSAYGHHERGTAGSFDRTRHYDQDYYRDPRERTLQHGIYYNSRRSPTRFDTHDPRYESRAREPFPLPSVVHRDIYRNDISREVRGRRPDRNYQHSRSRSPHSSQSRNQSPQRLASQASRPARSPSGSGSRSRSSSSDSISSSSSTSSDSSDSSSSSSDESPARSVQSAAVPAPPSQPLLSLDKDEPRKSFGIKVQNLPVRSTDTSLKDGLFHEFKKYGKVTSVQIHGVSEERYGLVFFRQQEDQEKALNASKGKLFFGMQIEVTAWVGPETESENEFRPLDERIDEFHPKATRTLFIGNLEKTTTHLDLHTIFQRFGEIVDIDVKKVNGVPQYAFLQYCDIASVCKAIKKMDGEYLGNNRLKLGFGKSMPTNCVWIDGLSSNVTEQYLTRHFCRYGPVVKVVFDRFKGMALVLYNEIEYAQAAVKETKGRKIGGNDVKVDFANQESQLAFYGSMETSGQDIRDFYDIIAERRADEPRRGSYEFTSTERTYYDTVRTPGTFPEETRREYPARSRELYADWESYQGDYYEQRYYDDSREYREFKDPYEQDIREYSYRQRERERERERFETDRDHERRQIERSQSPTHSRRPQSPTGSPSQSERIASDPERRIYSRSSERSGSCSSLSPSRFEKLDKPRMERYVKSEKVEKERSFESERTDKEKRPPRKEKTEKTEKDKPEKNKRKPKNHSPSSPSSETDQENEKEPSLDKQKIISKPQAKEKNDKDPAAKNRLDLMPCVVLTRVNEKEGKVLESPGLDKTKSKSDNESVKSPPLDQKLSIPRVEQPKFDQMKAEIIRNKVPKERVLASHIEVVDKESKLKARKHSKAEPLTEGGTAAELERLEARKRRFADVNLKCERQKLDIKKNSQEEEDVRVTAKKQLDTAISLRETSLLRESESERKALKKELKREVRKSNPDRFVTGNSPKEGQEQLPFGLLTRPNLDLQSRLGEPVDEQFEIPEMMSKKLSIMKSFPRHVQLSEDHDKDAIKEDRKMYFPLPRELLGLERSEAEEKLGIDIDYTQSYRKQMEQSRKLKQQMEMEMVKSEKFGSPNKETEEFERRSLVHEVGKPPQDVTDDSPPSKKKKTVHMEFEITKRERNYRSSRQISEDSERTLCSPSMRPFPFQDEDDTIGSPRLLPFKEFRESPKVDEKNTSFPNLTIKEEPCKLIPIESIKKEQVMDAPKAKLPMGIEEEYKWDSQVKQESGKTDICFPSNIVKRESIRKRSRDLEPGEVPSDSDEDSDPKSYSPKVPFLNTSRFSFLLRDGEDKLRDREERLSSSLERNKFYSFALDKTITPDTKALLERAKSLSSSREENWSFFDWDPRFANFRSNKDKEKVDSAPRPIPSWYMKKKKIRTDSDGKSDDKKEDNKEEEQEKQELFASRFLHSSIFEQDSKRLQHLEKKDEETDSVFRPYGRQLSSDGISNMSDFVQEPVVLFHSRFVELTRMQQKEKEKELKPKKEKTEEKETQPKTPDSLPEAKEPEVKPHLLPAPTSTSISLQEPTIAIPEKCVLEKMLSDLPLREEKPAEPATEETPFPVTTSAVIEPTVSNQSIQATDETKEVLPIPPVPEMAMPEEQPSYLDTKPPTPGTSFPEVPVDAGADMETDASSKSPKLIKKVEETDEITVENLPQPVSAEANISPKSEVVPEVQQQICENDVDLDPPITVKDRKTKNKRAKTPVQATTVSTIDKPVTRKSERIDREKRNRSTSPRGETQKHLEIKSESERISRNAAKSPSSVAEPEVSEPSLPLGRTRRRNVRSVYATTGDNDGQSTLKEHVEATRSTRKRIEKEIQEPPPVVVAVAQTTPKRGRPPKIRRKTGEAVSPIKADPVKQESEDSEIKEPVENAKPLDGWRSPRSQKLMQSHSPVSSTQQGKKGKSEIKTPPYTLEESNEEGNEISDSVGDDDNKLKSVKPEAITEQKHEQKEMETEKCVAETTSGDITERKKSQERGPKPKGRSRNLNTVDKASLCLKDVKIHLYEDEVKEAMRPLEDPEPVAVSPVKIKSPQKEDVSSELSFLETSDKDNIREPKLSPEAALLARQIELEQAVENIAKITETPSATVFKDAQVGEVSEGRSEEDGDKPAHQASETELAAAIGSIIYDIATDAETFPTAPTYPPEGETELPTDPAAVPAPSQPEEIEPVNDTAANIIFDSEASKGSANKSATPLATTATEVPRKESKVEVTFSESSNSAQEAESLRETNVLPKQKGRHKKSQQKRRKNATKKAEIVDNTVVSDNLQVRSPQTDEKRTVDERQNEKSSGISSSKPDKEVAEISLNSSSDAITHDIDLNKDDESPEIRNVIHSPQSLIIDDVSQTSFKLRSSTENPPHSPSPSAATLSIQTASPGKISAPVHASALSHSGTTISDWMARHEDSAAISTAPPALPPDTKASDVDTSSSTLRKILMEPKYVSSSNNPTVVTSSIPDPVSASLVEETNHPSVEPIKPISEEKSAVSLTNTIVPPAAEAPIFKEKVTIVAPKATSVISRMPPNFDSDELPRIALAKHATPIQTAQPCTPSQKIKQRPNTNDSRTCITQTMAVLDDRPTESGLRVNTSQGVMLLSYSGQKTEGPQRISAKISPIPPASAVDIEIQQSVSKTQIKQEPLTPSQILPKGPQTSSGYVGTHSLVTANQPYNASPVISSIKQERSLEKSDSCHIAVSNTPSQSGATKMLSQNNPPVLLHSQLIPGQFVSTNKKLTDTKVESKVLQSMNLSPGLSPHHSSLSGKIQSEANHVGSGSSTPTDRALQHIGVKQEAHSPCAPGHSPSPFTRSCHSNVAASSALSNNASVMLTQGMPVPTYMPSIHTEQTVIMPPHSVTQNVSLGHLSQGDVRINTPPLPSTHYGIRPEAINSPRAAMQQQIDGRPQRTGTPQPASVREMVIPTMSSQHPPEEEIHYHHPVRGSDVLVMQQDYRMSASGIRLDPYSVSQDVMLPRMMIPSHITSVGEHHPETRQSRTPEGSGKTPPTSKTPQPGKDLSKQTDVKMAHSPQNDSRILSGPSGQLTALSLSQPVVVPHGVPLIHPTGSTFHDYRHVYSDLRNYHTSTQLNHPQFSGASPIGLQSRSMTPSQVGPDNEHPHPNAPVRSKTPQVSQESKVQQASIPEPTQHAALNRHPGQMESHIQHLQRTPADASQTSYPSPVAISLKQELSASHQTPAVQKQSVFMSSATSTSSLSRTEIHPKQDPPQRPVDMVQLLTKYPIVWQGLLALKNDTAAVQLHFVSGNNVLAHRSLPAPEGGPPLRIAQRMRLEATQLEGVARRMMVESDYCLLLALPCGRDQEDVISQTESLKAAFITYLQAKQAAGIINVPNPGSNQPAYVLQIFPPCEFSESHLSRLAPDLLASISNISPHLMIVIASV